MKKRFFIFSTIVLLALSSVISGFPGGKVMQGQAQTTSDGTIVESYTDRMAVIPQFHSAPVLDGLLDESEWEGAWSGNGFVTMFNNEPAASDTDLLLGYDDANLYIGIEGHYYEAATEVETEIVEVLLSPGNNAGNYRLNIPITRGPRGINPNWGADATVLSQAQTKIQHSGDGWTLEISIPFSAMNITRVQAGEEWGFNVIRHYGPNSNPFTSYMPLRNGYYNDTGAANISMVVHAFNQNRLAPIYFSNLPNSKATPNRQQEAWQPETWELQYTGFTSKELVIQGGLFQADTELHMSWIAPDGMESVISDQTIVRNDNITTISFQHPRPLEIGLYRLKLSFRNGNGAYQYFEVAFDREAMIRAGDTLFQLSDAVQTKNVDPAPASDRVQQLLDLIPENTGFIFIGLPEDPTLRPSSLYEWSADKPWQMTAKSTGTVYPNEQFPEDKVLTAVNPLGEVVEYPYYEDEDGKRYFLTAHLWYFQKDYVLRETRKLASTDPLGAARLLVRWAEVYQGYMPTNDYYWTNYPLTSGPPYNYFGGVWYRWYTGDFSNLKQLIDAFATVRQSNAFDLLSDELGYDVEEYILEEMFEPSLEYVRSYPILSHNMEYHTWRGLIALSKATGDPSYMHEAVERIETYAKDHYLFDGFWKEVTLSYHNQSTNGLSTSINEAKGWSDPLSYVSPRTGRTLEQLDLIETFPALSKAQSMGNVLSYPNGSYVPVQDTWANEKSANPYTHLGSYLLPASGIARLAQEGTADSGSSALLYDFMTMEITEQSVDTRDFPASNTVQLEANEAGHSITFQFDVPNADTYTVELQPFRANSYGEYNILIDGEIISQYDFYDTTGGVKEYEEIAVIELSEGIHTISFVNTGKREDSSNYKMGVVGLALLNEEAMNNPGHTDPQEPNPSQLYMMFTPKYGHNHYDPLNLTLFAEGQELLPDLGYTHTNFRRWSMSTLAHNTVLVNGQDMNRDGDGSHGGQIEALIPVSDNVQIMKASQQSAYPMTEEYSREPWMIEFGGDEGKGYVVDIFRVSGGERHEYTLGGDANRDSYFDTEIALEDYNDYLLPPGTSVRMPNSETDTGSADGHYYGYIYVQDVKRADIPAGQVNLTLVTEEEGEEQAKLNITSFIGEGNNELFIGEAPSMRATRLNGTSQDINTEAVKYWMPKMVVRRSGDDLHSTFVTVMEPHKNDKLISNIEQLIPATDGNVAIKVTYGDYTDIILSSANPNEPLVVGDITLNGNYGFIRLHNGEIDQMKLIGGTLLQKGEVQLAGNGPQKGVIEDVMRVSEGDPFYAFITDAAITGDIAGHYLIVTHPDGTKHGYPIKEVQSYEGKTAILLDDTEPGWTIYADGSSGIDFYPFKHWTGQHHFYIDNVEEQ